MSWLENVLQSSLQRRTIYHLFLLEMLLLIVGKTSATLRLKASKVPGGPLFSGKTTFVHSTVSYKHPALTNTTELVLVFKMPSYVVYEQYSSNGSLSPDDVTESKDGNFRFVTFKFKRLLTSEHVDIQVAVHVHRDDGFDDGSFHNAPCVVSLRYHNENPCGSATLEQTEVAMTQISFYSPECDGFVPLNQLSGGTKDSQITASSSRIKDFLPYSVKCEDDLSGWTPLRGSGGELHTVHFIQVDLRYAIQTKFVAAVQGLSPKIPTDKLVLVLSEDGVEWTEKKTGIETGVDRSAGSTLTVMKIYKFSATARFVRFVLPPFQKPGGEQPVYKAELYGCPYKGKTNGKSKKVTVPVGVGMESGIIPDNQLTSSSSQGPEYGAQYSRLNSRLGAGAWCAGSCDPSEFLQIDLGQVYLIHELEVQSKHDSSGDTNSVLSFYFEYSADGALWEYYTANGANKLFVGSPVRNLAVRHKLLFPVHAHSVRFRPQTDECTNMACMRVELFWYPDPDPESPVIFARSFLLEESTNTMFACNTEVKKSESHCKGSIDGGETWKDLHQNVLIVLAYNPIDNVYYGISINKKTFLRSKSFPFSAWNGISNNIWYRVKGSPSLITATEVPFIPALAESVHEPFAALTLPRYGVSLKRRRRSVASVDMWGSSSQGLLFKPSGAIVWKMVYSWIDYPYDIKVGCLGMPCENGTCSKISDGGYKCSCFPGFTGKNCRQDIDECASNPCINGATCVDQVNGFNCACPPGFTGTLCGIDIDECASSPCVNGDCIDGVNQYKCNCHPGNTGLHCELDIDECASKPCRNGGVCVNGVNKFTCNCTLGFTGLQCETNIDDCASNACVNGYCVDGVNQYTCSCYPGNAGVHCEFDIDECASSPCVDGDCIDGVNQYTCNCHPGKTGLHCELDIDECASNPCINGATCVDQVNSFNCTCLPGFTGILCGVDIDECASSLCVNGDCIDGVNQYSCNCHPGKTGLHCELDFDECASVPCKNGGVCVNEVNKFTCNCTPGFTGLQCEINIDDCASNACVNGYCVDGVNQYTCSCYPGNAGVYCEFDLSCVTSNPCFNGGTCIPSPGGGYTCHCTFFYSGSNCQLGAFSCLRLVTYSFDPPYWPNTGKFDKIAFSLSADHKFLGISVGSTAQQGIPVTLTIKVSNISGSVIASKTTQHTFGQEIPAYPVFFDQPILLTANQQYIAASLVEAEASMPELARIFDGSAIRFCNPHLTVTFSNVPTEEMTDSNGSTVEEGQIIFLYFKPP